MIAGCSSSHAQAKPLHILDIITAHSRPCTLAIWASVGPSCMKLLRIVSVKGQTRDTDLEFSTIYTILPACPTVSLPDAAHAREPLG
jgi:hypothetical protein